MGDTEIYATATYGSDTATRTTALSVPLEVLLDEKIPTDWTHSLTNLFAQCNGDLDHLYRTLVSNLAILSHQGRHDLAGTIATDLLCLLRTGVVAHDRRECSR